MPESISPCVEGATAPHQILGRADLLILNDFGLEPLDASRRLASIHNEFAYGCLAHAGQARDRAITTASSSSDRTVDLGCLGPVGRSETEDRAFHLATVFGLTP
jgi:hypothetical protein